MSDTSVPGEGEIKIIDYIRNDTDENVSHCVYGNDADLINLLLITGKPKIAILREMKGQYSMLYLSKLRDYFEIEFQNQT